MLQFHKERLSYYLDSVGDLMPCPVARGHYTPDVLIIGGGFAGISAAMQCKLHGLDTMVIEARYVGFGASGKNGGQAIFGFHHGFDYFKQKFGGEFAQSCWDIAYNSLQYFHKRRNEYNIACDWQNGYATVAHREADLEHYHSDDDFYQKNNYPLRYFGAGEIKEFLNTPLYVGGIYDEQSGHAHPLKFLLGLKKQILSMGVNIFEQSPAQQIDTENTMVKTEYATIKPKHIIICGNAMLNYAGVLVKPLYDKLMPVGSYIIATEPLPKADFPFVKPSAFSDTNFILDYYRPTADRRILFGGRCSYTTIEPGNLVEWMLPRLRKVFPSLPANIKIDYAWGGLIDITYNRNFHVGRLGRATLFAQGFCGHGFLTANYLGKILGDAVVKTSHEYDVLSQFSHISFPGGPIRTPLLALAMLSYRLRDKWF